MISSIIWLSTAPNHDMKIEYQPKQHHRTPTPSQKRRQCERAEHRGYAPERRNTEADKTDF